MIQTEKPELQGIANAEILPIRLAITAMRDSGYKNTAYALAELIDNAIQANASVVEVLCIEQREFVSERQRRRLHKIAILDNGSGMDEDTLQMALQFGNGTRLHDRTGIGRFGIGLPNASISQARRIDIWSWQNGPDNAIHSYIDLNKIESEGMRDVPRPKYDPVPDAWRNISRHIGKSGTLVVWEDIDLARLTWKSAKATLDNTERIVGRVYRRFIMDESVVIRLVAMEHGSSEPTYDKEAVFDDPLYLTASAAMPQPFNHKPMFESVFDEEHEITHNGEVHKVVVRYSVASRDTITEAGTQFRGSTEYGIRARGNIGVSVVRAGREIMLDQGWCIGYDPRERWWGCEVEFPPALDEIFGVTNNKQAATHFSELAVIESEQFCEAGEEFFDMVSRLTEEGDPRGHLLNIVDSIKRNLSQIRDTIKAQGAGPRSTSQNRHEDTLPKADPATDEADKRWKEREREHPIEGENVSPTEDDLEEIRTDLKENKKYSEIDAANIVSLIRDADLRVLFLEADFTNAYELFNVEMKGTVTEITFNRKHRAFDDIFGTITTVDENVDELTTEEVLERLIRAVNSIKIIFAAWARYEREAGISKLQMLQKVRFDWGQMAGKFLQPASDSIL